jgi:FtsH-binding integral membrane protein
MGGALKTVLVMLAVPLAYSGLSIVFGSALSLWGAVCAAGLLGVMWFHRARRRPVFLPYIIIWVLLFGGLYYASGSVYCASADVSPNLPPILCPFPQGK